MYDSAGNELAFDESPSDVVKAVKGHSTMYTMVAWKGEMLAGHYATRTNTVSEGGPSTCVEISANDECAEYCRRMVAAMGFSGFLSFDFMWDEERHLHVLLECNPRPNQIIHLGTAMGADLCGQLAAALRGENPGMRRVAGVTRVALFPQYWLTEGAEAAAQAEHLDVPFGDPELLAFMLEVGAKRGLDRDEIEKVLLTAVPAL